MSWKENIMEVDMKTIKLDAYEYAKVVSEINNKYYTFYDGKLFCAHTSFGIDNNVYTYWFMNYGFDNYQFIKRILEY